MELTGFTVGITADRRWDEQAALFERRGAAVVHGPAITTLPLGAETPLRQATDDVIACPPAVLIANTGVGIRSWFAHAEAWGMGQALQGALSGTRIYARGPKASGAVHSAGMDVAARAATERMNEIVDLVIDRLQPGERVAVQLDGSGASAEIDRLRAHGADVLALPVYRWTVPDDTGPTLRLAEAILDGRVQAVTFTAGPAIRNWLAIAEENGIARDLSEALTGGHVVVGCVGPVCAQVAVSEGLGSPNLVQPEAHRLGPLVRAVTERLVARRVSVDIAGTAMTISGNALIMGDEYLSLTHTEARLLATLAARPNAVYTKEQLLRAVWGSPNRDPHTVEVGIARLRRRLGPYGHTVRSVHRRGYTLRT